MFPKDHTRMADRKKKAIHYAEPDGEDDSSQSELHVVVKLILEGQRLKEKVKPRRLKPGR